MQQRERIRKAVAETASLEGMRKSFKTIKERQKENSSRISDLDARKERLRKTKEHSVGNEELFTRAVAVLRENGFRVLLAKDAQAAIRVVKEELGDEKLVVKSKSNVTKEIHLAENLGKLGIEVVETDLGDRIIQLAGCPAAHPTGPACHLTRKQISALFSDHFRKQVSEDPRELTKVMREEISSYLDRARVGITGANAIAANEGAVVIVHNEGNAARCAMLPEKHIIVTTPEKVVPDLDEAVNVTKLQTYLSTGKVISSYINIITGPSYTADIEKQVFRGMHGPKEVVIVFVDDGRLDAADKEAMYCIGCGMCLLHCPIYNVVGPEFGGSGHMGGQGAYLAGSKGDVGAAIESGLYVCTSCGACVEACPAKIDTKKGLMNIRKTALKHKMDDVPEHQEIVSSVRNYDNPWKVPRSQKQRWAKDLGLKPAGKVLYFAGCSTSLIFPKNAINSISVLRGLGAEPAYLGKAEKCCGSTVRKIGFEDLAREKAEECFKDFRKAGAQLVVTSCPGCSSALNHYEDLRQKYGIEVKHISQFVDEHTERARLRKITGIGRVSYHDPCDLGRESGVYDEPRRVIAKVLGASPLEMDLNRKDSACCGSGSGVKSSFPELASAVALNRVHMAEAAGADAIVTSCPWCVQSLTDCQTGESRLKVYDLVEVVAMALGRERN